MAVTTTNFDTVSPNALGSTNTYVALAPLDVSSWRSVSYTLKAATNSIKWTVYGANASDYSDEVVVQSEATVTTSAAGSYSITQAPFRYYRVKIKSAVDDTAGTATVNGIAKA